MMFRLMTTNPSLEISLAHAWMQGSEDQIVHELKNLSIDASWQDKEILSKDVFDILRETPSARIRNAATMALVGLGVEHAIKNIVDVLRRKDIVKSSGTLLFALNEINASIPLNVLMEIVELGSFEARNQAMFFLEEGRFEPVDLPSLEDAVSHLDKLIEVENPEIVEAADFAREHLLTYATDHYADV